MGLARGCRGRRAPGGRDAAGRSACARHPDGLRRNAGRGEAARRRADPGPVARAPARDRLSLRAGEQGGRSMNDGLPAGRGFVRRAVGAVLRVDPARRRNRPGVPLRAARAHVGAVEVVPGPDRGLRRPGLPAPGRLAASLPGPGGRVSRSPPKRRGGGGAAPSGLRKRHAVPGLQRADGLRGLARPGGGDRRGDEPALERLGAVRERGPADDRGGRGLRGRDLPALPRQDPRGPRARGPRAGDRGPRRARGARPRDADPAQAAGLRHGRQHRADPLRGPAVPGEGDPLAGGFRDPLAARRARHAGGTARDGRARRGRRRGDRGSRGAG